MTSGIYSSIQDNGRYGVRNLGVPLSGAMDQYSAYIANSLLGNNKQSAVLEMTYKGPVLLFHDKAIVTIVGSTIDAELNNQKVRQNGIITLEKGDVLSLGKISQGARCYLAILGGFESEQVLNSQSQYSQITKKALLKKGDLLFYDTQKQLTEIKHSSVKLDTKHFKNEILYVYAAPEFETLNQSILSQLIEMKLTVDISSNRMAYKLKESLAVQEDSIKEIITASVQPGTVQITPSGEIIILMRDCQTTGGYARIFQLSDYSINQLAQKTPGSTVYFSLI
ncbi:MAG: biotin-dependent carboxyltransferase family protein [Marinicellaceae bacterium]